MPQAGARADLTRRLSGARLLFLPRCGSQGIGEYVRCLTLAQAFHARHPDAQVRFAVEASKETNRGLGQSPGMMRQKIIFYLWRQRRLDQHQALKTG